MVGFSGGVDSAMTALLLREQGYDVRGAMMSVRDASGLGCGRDGDGEAAKSLAERLGIPFVVIDCSGPYRTFVLEHFKREYLAGRTPNPCVACNPHVKFAALPTLARAAGLEFDRFATGHYARIEFNKEHGRHVLLRGVDHSKDQSYFLYRLDESQLAMTLFPLGDKLKTEVRAMAQERGVPVHDKPDSQDFYAGDYADILGLETLKGDIVDIEGKVLGSHNGYWHFTPGQRKGLGVAHKEALYVLHVEPAANRVVVGTQAQQLRAGCVIEAPYFPGGNPPQGTTLKGRLRSSQPLREMIVGENSGDGMTILFNAPIHGVAPGQSLVLYDGEEVVGGGIIQKAL